MKCCLGSDETQQGVVKFSDESPGHLVNIPAPISYANLGTSANTDIQQFLSRPVEISTISWTEGTSLGTSLRPWHLYFNNAAIKKKLDNYYLLRCNLHIKLTINASPFYYGCGMVSYRPVVGYDPAPVFSGAGLTSLELVGRSQRPRFFFYPQTNQGGEMVLPFMYHKQWLDATVATDLQDMGELNVISFDVLRNANSVAGVDSTVQIFAWATEVELAGPTEDVAVQSTDQSEYSDNGPVSGPASAVAAASSKAIDAATALAPITGGLSLLIEPFAVATGMVASTIGSVAKLFGYTNVPVIEDVRGMKPHPFPQMASTQIGTPVEKLTVDSKNELTIDPKVCGFDGADELLISKLATRESFIDSFSWIASRVPDDLLWNVRVTPHLLATASVASDTHTQGTPLWWLNRMFSYWRGDIIFRFKFVCSQYHRGRVRISWDPRANIGSIANTTTTNYTQIVDISKHTDIEIRVPYIQETPFLETGENNTQYYGTTPLNNNLAYNNGLLTVRVLTDQTSPVSSADIDVLVFVRGAENIEFAAPRPIPNTITPYAIQSTDISYEETEEQIMGGEKGHSIPELNLIYMGEKILSLRNLMRRSSHVFSVGYAVASNNGFAFSSEISRYPLFPGFDPNGIHIAQNIIAGPGSSFYNYVNWTYLNWVSMCFVGQRGSVIWHYNVDGEKKSRMITVGRADGTSLTAAGYVGTDTLAAFTTTSVNAHWYATTLSQGTEGYALTSQDTLAGLSVLAPMYSRFKFQSTSPATRTLGTSVDASDKDIVTSRAYYHDVNNGESYSAHWFCSIGTDYNPVFFLNVPGLHVQSSIPAP
jgi:hypothetical protein